MPKFLDRKLTRKWVVLALGKDGSGKTVALASFATKDEPMFIFDCDRRMDSLWTCEDILKDNLPYIEYESYDAKDGFTGIQDKFKQFLALKKEGQLKFKNILIENTGVLLSMWLRDCLRLKGYKPELISDLSKVKGGARVVGNVIFTGPDEYNYQKNALETIVYEYFPEFTDDCNIFLSGWSVDEYGKEKDDEGNILNQYGSNVLIGRKLLATDKIAGALPGYFNEVWEFDKEETGGEKNPVKYSVKFTSRLAKTTRKELVNKKLDITNKNFKQELDKILNRQEVKANA